MDNRDDIQDFLATRRAKLTPADVGLPTSARRRVPGLRREEVAVLAGVSTEWNTKLEKGHIAGVSEEVLAAVADALRLDVIGVNALGRALHAAMFDSPTARGGRANFARYHFLDPGSWEFFVDWEGGCRRDGRPAAGRGGACAARHGAAGADRRALHGQRAVQRALGLPRHPHPP
ncbi:helix-turn-helix domain-containing protein [Kocuria palustris]|uniref:helix-turn-helix domain-containing protein n=1 Tax=Kocuria palustris TaxID=71999 RepID=UPI002E13C4F2